MSYWDNACATFFPRIEGNPRVKCEERSFEKFKECCNCTFFDTWCESYTCNHPDGKNCLLELGVNHFTPTNSSTP